MREIWGAVLGIEHVGIDDNFFELGGDSILSIPVVAKCRAAGLNISSRDLFKARTISGLSEVLSVAVPSGVVADEGTPSGVVPLTPIQHWFFEQELEHPDHWNQSFVFEVPPNLDVDVLEEALQHVVVHHDALRLHFQKKGGWLQEYGTAPAATPIVRVDVSPLPPEDRSKALIRRASTMQERLDVAGGPLLRAMHFDYGDDAPGRFVLAIHHLVVDGVSWRILLEDLEAAYVARSERRGVALPPRTTSYKRWSEALTAHAADDEFQTASGWWLDAIPSDLPSLPRDHDGGSNLEETARSVSVWLDRVETQGLLQRVPAVFGSEIGDALLSALGRALAAWASRDSFVIDVEGHGREDLFDGIDLSRTVGWFTTIYPFRLEATSRSSRRASGYQGRHARDPAPGPELRPLALPRRR